MQWTDLIRYPLCHFLHSLLAVCISSVFMWQWILYFAWKFWMKLVINAIFGRCMHCARASRIQKIICSPDGLACLSWMKQYPSVQLFHSGASWAGACINGVGPQYINHVNLLVTTVEVESNYRCTQAEYVLLWWQGRRPVTLLLTLVLSESAPGA